MKYIYQEQLDYTCDSCGGPIDNRIKGKVAGGTSLCRLQADTGGLYHKEMQRRGWAFHYHCYDKVYKYLMKLSK